jgi:pyruvate kinase
MPGEAADDPRLIQNQLRQGMNCMRINCAHDDKSVWLKMVNHLKLATKSLKIPCQIVMDLPGPKLRTGPMEVGVAVIRVRPKRDALGTVVRPPRLWLTISPTLSPAPSPADAELPVDKAWLAKLRAGEQIAFSDVRGSKRVMTVVDVTPKGCWAELTKSAYVVPGTKLRRKKTEPVQ